MEQKERKHNRLGYYDYGQKGSYFVTLCTHSRLPLFKMESIVGNCLRAVPRFWDAQQRERHTGRSLRFFLIDQHPFGWVVFDVLPGFVIILLIADHMVIIGFLPELLVERRQHPGFNSTDVVGGSHGFEVVHDIL